MAGQDRISNDPRPSPPHEAPPSLQGQVLRFALIGALAFVVDAVTLDAAMRFGDMNHYVGRVISYLLAATFTWALNRRYTFYAHASNDRLSEWAKFLAANAFGGLLNYATYAVLVAFSHTIFAHPVLGVAAGSLAGMTVNFALSRRFVFTTGRTDVG